MASPIRDPSGKVIGTVVGAVKLDEANFLDSIIQRPYGKTGGFLLVAPKHNLFVTASDKSRVLQPLPPAGVNPMHDKYMSGYEAMALPPVRAGWKNSRLPEASSGRLVRRRHPADC
jgi:hypothetical protein